MRLCSKGLLLACLVGGAALAADSTSPDPALLEYLGTYDTSAPDGLDPVALAELDDAAGEPDKTGDSATSSASPKQDTTDTREAGNVEHAIHP